MHELNLFFFRPDVDVRGRRPGRAQPPPRGIFEASAMTSFAALLAVIMWSECAAWSSPSRGARVGRVKAVEDDDAEFAAALSRAEARTRGDREELEKRARRAARESRRDARTYAPQKPRLAMKDTRVRASQEPMQELKELYDEGSWQR